MRGSWACDLLHMYAIFVKPHGACESREADGACELRGAGEVRRTSPASGRGDPRKQSMPTERSEER